MEEQSKTRQEIERQELQETLKELEEEKFLIVLLMRLFYKPDIGENIAKEFKQYIEDLREKGILQKATKEDWYCPKRKLNPNRKYYSKGKLNPKRKINRKESIPLTDKTVVKRLLCSFGERLKTKSSPVFRCKSLTELGLVERKYMKPRKFTPKYRKIAKLMIEADEEYSEQDIKEFLKNEDNILDTAKKLNCIVLLLPFFDIHITIEGREKPLSTFFEHLSLFRRWNFLTLVMYLDIILRLFKPELKKFYWKAISKSKFELKIVGQDIYFKKDFKTWKAQSEYKKMKAPSQPYKKGNTI